jgi:hypothetical protein
VIRAALFACLALALAPRPADALHFVSPASGTVVRPGDLVTVQLALDSGETATEVGLFDDGQAVAATLAGTVYSTQIRIPSAAVGPDLLVAYAVLAGGGAAIADLPIVVDPGPLRTLFVSVPARFAAPGQTSGIEVRGVFEDGIVRDLSSPEVGTTFASDNPSVVAVHAAGIAQGRASGTATVSATSFGRTATTRVAVQIPAANTNGIPVITPAGDQTVAAEQIVVLSAQASDPDGDAVEYVWDQIAGRVVVLHAPKSATPEFVAPRTSTPLVLEFLVSARDAKGAMTLPALVRVTVNPVTP